ncbi:hypothetical protein [Thiomonas sp.]
MALRDYYRKYLPDPYPALEREAIQREEDAPASDDYSDIPGFEDCEVISLADYRKILTRIHGWRYQE